MTLETAMLGLLWGVLILHLLPRGGPDTQAMVLGFTLLCVAVAAFCTSIVPPAAAALTLPVLVCAGIALGAGFDAAVLVISLGLAVARGTVVTSFAFVARMKTQHDLLAQEEVIRLLLNEQEVNGSDWLFQLDAEGRITRASARFAAAAGVGADALRRMHLADLVADAPAAERLRDALDRRDRFRDLLLPVSRGAETGWWRLAASPRHDRQGRFTGWHGVGSDVTTAQRDAERINELLAFDPLTGLFNRRTLGERLAATLKRGDAVQLMFVDLDRFKLVNDTLGHGAGDLLLRLVARRLAACVGDAGTVGRLGGDEFAVLVEHADRDRADALGRDVIATCSQPYDIDGKTVSIGASIGCAEGPADGVTVETLLRAADLALYDAKNGGRGRLHRYDGAMHAAQQDRRALEFDLSNALANGELSLAFQPIVDAADERVAAFEALLRWTHPTRGNIPPLQFIPIAEETGAILDIGRWVLDAACREAAHWPPHVRVAVNLSARQFEDPALVEHVRDALRRNGLAPARLELELTESLFLAERPHVQRMMAALRALGVGFALDDFGTGYSSLGYLHRTPISRIKIDRSFVASVADDRPEGAAVIEAIISMAAKLGMSTTAEGAETRASFEAMREMGCTQVQGWLFGKPMPAAEARAMVAERQAA